VPGTGLLSGGWEVVGRVSNHPLCDIRHNEVLSLTVIVLSMIARGACSRGKTDARMRSPFCIAIMVVLSLFALMFWQVSMDAKEADTAAAALALACEGTVADKINRDAKPEPISMAITVNFTAGSVTGFTGANFPVAITSIDDVRILFRGLNSTPASFAAVFGSINRITRAVEATTDGIPTLNSLTRYSLKCDEV
jgi:hypothetical protein